MRTSSSLMDDSVFKNPLFPTPSFAITPGPPIFTPFKDMISPRSDQEVVYGAANRPTDYSSSSSYYKPDESDGIDKQIQASIQSDRKNSGVDTADEMDDNSKINDSTQNTLNESSSSSSSSSGSSDSDSDSDSSSSSDSDVSRVSHKSMEKAIQPNETEQIEQIEQIEPMETIDEDSKLQTIKSVLDETKEVKIAQNYLLSEPEAPMLNEEAKQWALLDEKRRRMQESLRESEMKNHVNFKPKATKKYRTIADAKRDRLRAPPFAISPSKRKSSQPKKIVSVDSQTIYTQLVNVMAGQSEQITQTEVKTQSVTTERLITEAAEDNAIVDASDVSTKQKSKASPTAEEESVEAIKSHINKSAELADDVAMTAKEKATATKCEKLVEILSEKQKKFEANRPKMKAEVIAALPIRTTRSRARNQPIIRPAQNILTKQAVSTSSNVKTASNSTVQPKGTRRSKEKAVENITSKPAKKSKEEPPKSEPSKTQPAKATSSVSNKLADTLATPAKEKRSRQILDIFGDFSDMDTPIKSPAKTSSRNEQKAIDIKEEIKAPSQTKPSNKFEADSSNVKDEDDVTSASDSESESDTDGDGYEMIFSIDENDKKRFICVRENASVKSKGTPPSINIRTKNVVLDGVKVTLAPSDEMELYEQDVNSAAQFSKEQHRSRSVKEAKSSKRESNEPSSSSEEVYGKPLHTSTPSPTKAITPKFNIKHKSSDNM